MLNGTDRDRLNALLPGALPRSARLERMDEGHVLRWDTVPRRVTVAVSVTDRDTGAPVHAAVSDGENVRRFSAAPVHFALAVEAGDLRFVHVCVPAGYEPDGPWFRRVPPDEETEQYAFEFRLRASPKTAQDRFRFLVTADSQGSGAVWREELAAAFDEMARIEEDPLFLVNCGDLTMTGWVEEWRDYAQARRQGPARYYELFGGHGGNYALHLNNDGSRRGGTGHFGLFCGPDHYAWDCGRFHCIALNAVLNHYEAAAVCERQRGWLQEDLNVARDGRPVLLFSHYDTRTLREELGLQVDGVHSVFYGHWHWNGVEQDDGIWQVRTAPLRGEDWGRMSACVRVCDVDSARVTDELRPLGERRRLERARAVTPPQAPHPTPRPGADWPSFLNGEGDRYRTTRDHPSPPFEPAWSTPTGGRHVLLASPVLADGRLYVGIHDERIGWPSGGLACYDAVTGDELWRADIPPVLHTPAVRDGKVYAITVQADAVCLDAAHGTKLWRTSFRDHALGARTPATFCGDHLLVGAYLHRTCLLDAQTGSELAAYDAEHFMVSSATGFDGRVFGTMRYAPHACDAVTGKRLWTAEEQGIRYTAPPLRYGNEVLYFCGPVYALDPATGATRWHCDAVGTRRGQPSPAIADGVAYVTGDLQCVAIDLATHQVAWRTSWDVPEDLRAIAPRSDTYACLSSPAATPEFVVFGDDTGIVRALRRSDGREVWTWRVGLPVKTAPIVSGNMLYLLDYNGNLHALTGRT